MSGEDDGADRADAAVPAGPEAKPRTGSVGVPVLMLVRPLAALAIVAMLLGRVVGPSAMGVWMGRLSAVVELTGDVTSQLFAMLATVVLIAEILVVTRGKFGLPVRVAAIVLGGFVVMVGLAAAAIRVSATSGALIGLSGAAFALAAAWDARRAPFARAATAVVGLVGVASLLRLGGVAIAVAADRPGRPPILVTLARVMATLSFVFDACAIGASTTWMAARTRRLTTPATIVALVLAFLITRQVLVVDPEDVGALGLLLRRGAERLLTRPDPFVPVPLRVFVSVLAPLIAAATLFARGSFPALSGTIALALVVRSSPEMPLGAVSLLIASLTLVLAARDERGVWTMIGSERPGVRGVPAGSEVRGAPAGSDVRGVPGTEVRGSEPPRDGPRPEPEAGSP